MTALVPYDVYKESGVEWLGEVPSLWKVVRNKEIFAERGVRSLTGKETLLTVSHITGVTPRSEKNVNMFMAETMEGYKLCQIGDLLINTMWAWMGALGTSNYQGICSPSYHVYMPRKDIPYNHRYFDYLYRIPNSIVEMTRNSKGIVSSRLRLYAKDFFQIKTVLPPLDEQNAIAAYLDEKTAQIDHKIDLLTQKAEQYRQLKQSLINETVTHGLDKIAPLKDSGIEWLGEIPAHWEVKRIKNIARSVNGGAFKNGLVEFGIPIIKIKQLTLGCKATDFCDPQFTKITKDNRLASGDLVFTWSTLIYPFIYVGEDALLNQHIFKIIHSRNIFRKWLYYKLIQSTQRLKVFAHGSTMQHILKSDFDNLEIELPPFAEQKAIADYLDAKTAEMDRIVETINRQIEALRELRKTLINDVVTGKIKVID